jgi:hypothetical protein
MYNCYIINGAEEIMVSYIGVSDNMMQKIVAINPILVCHNGKVSVKRMCDHLRNKTRGQVLSKEDADFMGFLNHIIGKENRYVWFSESSKE